MCEFSKQRYGQSQTSRLRVSHREQTFGQAALRGSDTFFFFFAGIFNRACARTGTRRRDEARCSRGIGRRGAKCPAGRLRLHRLGGNMSSWVLLLLLAALSAARLRLGSAEVRAGCAGEHTA